MRRVSSIEHQHMRDEYKTKESWKLKSKQVEVESQKSMEE